MVNVLREAKGSQPNFMAVVGFEDWSLPAPLIGTAGVTGGLSNNVPELHRRIPPLVAVYTLGDPGLDATKLATKEFGFPLSPTVRNPALPTPPDSEKPIEKVFEAAGLLPVQGEA